MKRIIPETIYDYRMVSAPSLSPDGTMTAFLVTRADEKTNDYPCNLYVLKDGHSRQVTSAGDILFFLWTDRGTLLTALKRRQQTDGLRTVFCEIDA